MDALTRLDTIYKKQTGETHVPRNGIIFAFAALLDQYEKRIAQLEAQLYAKDDAA